MNELMKFDFQFDGWSSEVNVLEIEGEPWFLLKSIANILEIDDVSNLSRRLKPYEKLTRTLYVAGQNRDVLLVSESGLYRLVLTSRKPQAEPFQDWVCQEVLPQIRKTGSYIQNLTPGELLVEQAKRFLEVEREQARQAKQLEKTTKTANEAKEGLENVRNELVALKEFAVAQPEGLDQNQADLIKQAFAQLGKVLDEANIVNPGEGFKQPWRELGLTMRNSSIKYDLNARSANAKRQYEKDYQTWVDNGKPKGQCPKKPSRITILLRDNQLTNAFKAAQQVVKSYLAKLNNS